MEFIGHMCLVLLQKIRNKVKMIAEKNASPHCLSRGGYDLLKRRIIEEKLKRRQAKSPSTDHVSPPSPPERCDLWVLARTTPKRNITSKRTSEVSERIVSP